MGTQLQLNVLQANDVVIDFTVTQADGVTPQDLTGLTPELVIKASSRYTDTGATVLGPGTGLTIVSVSAGTLTALLSETVTAMAGIFWYRLDLIDNLAERTTAIFGPLSISAV